MKWNILAIGKCVLCVSWSMCLMCSMIFMCDCCWPHFRTQVSCASNPNQERKRVDHEIKSKAPVSALLTAQLPIHLTTWSISKNPKKKVQYGPIPKFPKNIQKLLVEYSWSGLMTWVLSNAVHSPAISIKQCLNMSYQPNLQLFTLPPSRVYGASGEAPGGTNDKTGTVCMFYCTGSNSLHLRSNASPPRPKKSAACLLQSLASEPGHVTGRETELNWLDHHVSTSSEMKYTRWKNF